VISDAGELVLRLEIEEEGLGLKIHKVLSNNILSISKPSEMRLAIDAFGQQSRPFLILASGEPLLDQAALEWAASQAWSRRLPPGSYRLQVGP
jgi:hypothetical protein